MERNAVMEQKAISVKLRECARMLLEVADEIQLAEGAVQTALGQTAESDYDKAIEVIHETRRASVSHSQRKLGWGYDHACGVMDRLEKDGIVGPKVEVPREIFWDKFPRV